MKKEHGQVTGIIWRGPTEMATYQKLREYADQQGLSVPAAAKQLLTLILNTNQG